MKNTEYINKIQIELARCLVGYGDQPQELVKKLEELILEWFIKGTQHIIGEK